MGREIRRVPPNFKHPTVWCDHNPRCFGNRCFKPLYGDNYEEIANEWIVSFEKWQQKTESNNYKDKDGNFFWDYEWMPPNKKDYRSYSDQEATWYQVYETISEGTPVSPPFETLEELKNYLIENGDFFDQRQGRKPSVDSIEKFIKDGLCPSAIMFNGIIKVGIDCLDNK